MQDREHGRTAPPNPADPSCTASWKYTTIGEPSFAERAALARAEATLFGGESVVRIDRYRVERLLGRGAFGSVYAAVDEKLDRRVAVKLQRSGSVGASAQAVRQTREAQAMARLAHPNVVRVFDVGAWQDRFFIVMEIVQGENLRTWLRRASSHERILEVFADAAAGLAAIHRAGLVHRDFKPDNVLVDADGTVKVTDLGLARKTTHSELESGADASSWDASIDAPFDRSVTAAGTIMGTPAYLAPELFRGGRADARSDQFAFCVALFEALYGHRPFEGADLIALHTAVVGGHITAPPPERRGSKRVYETVLRGLNLDPAARFDSMDALVHALASNRRRRWLWAGGVAAASLATLGLVASVDPQSDSPCGAQAPALWSPVVSDQLRARIAEVPNAATWRRFSEAARTYADGWSVANERLCGEASAASPSGDDDRHALARLCLSAGHERFSALIADIQNATALTAAIPGLEELRAPLMCLQPTHAPNADRIEVLRREIGGAEFGSGKQMRAALDELESEVREIDDAPLTAEFLAAHAVAARRSGDPALAREEWRQALQVAQGCGHAVVAAETATFLCQDSPYSGQSTAQCKRRCDEAVAAAERSGQPMLILAARGARASTVAELGDNAGAQAELESVLAAQRELQGDLDPNTIETMAALSSVSEWLGDTQRAIDLNREVLAVVGDQLGTDHPAYFGAMDRLGSSMVAAGGLDEALVLYTEAYESCVAARGELAPECRTPLGNRAQALLELRRPEEARADLAEVLRASVGDDSDPTVMGVRINMGLALLEDDPAAALAGLSVVVDESRVLFGERDVTTVKALEVAGAAAFALSRFDDAFDYASAAWQAAQLTFGPHSRDTLEIGIWLVRIELARHDLSAARGRLAAAEAAAVGCNEAWLLDQLSEVRRQTQTAVAAPD